MAGPAPDALSNHEDRDARPVRCSIWLCRSLAAYSTRTKSSGAENVVSKTQPPTELWGPWGEPALPRKKLPGP